MLGLDCKVDTSGPESAVLTWPPARMIQNQKSEAALRAAEAERKLQAGNQCSRHTLCRAAEPVSW